MIVSVYAFTHKKFDVPSDPMYIPLQVGAAVNEDLGYLKDDVGDNISSLNCYYSELTGMYWLWKHENKSDIIGTCHYRRFLIDSKEIVLTKEKICDYLAEYDLITTKPVLLNNSYYYGFSANHNIKALDTTGEVIKDLYPDYYETFITLVNGPYTYFGNMIICRHELYNRYCNWLFTIFKEVEKRIDLDTDEDAYHKRVLGFISEFLLYVFVNVNGLKAKHCKVGMFGEKIETKEMKEKLAKLFLKGDAIACQNYFMEEYQKRPDLMMEASDITGELRLAMQIIATAKIEREKEGKNIFDYERDFRKLIQIFTKLNNALLHEANHNMTEDDKAFLESDYVSETMKMVAKKVVIRMER